MLTKERTKETKTSQILFRCRDEERAELMNYSKKHNIPMSVLCRQALREAGVLTTSA